jgi:hypothetical protein
MGRTWRARPTRDWRAHLIGEEKVVVAAIEKEQTAARKIISAAATKRQEVRKPAAERARRDAITKGKTMVEGAWVHYLSNEERKLIAAMDQKKAEAQKRLAAASKRLRPIRSLCIARARYEADVPPSRVKVLRRVNRFNAKKRQT